MSAACPQPPLALRGLAALSGLAADLPGHLAAIAGSRSPFRPLGELGGIPPEFHDLAAAWIGDRAALTDRLWSPAAVAAIAVAREAIADAGWSPREAREALVVFATSRGNVAGWIDPWPGRRPFPLMAASNSLASEPAAAICSEFAIDSEWHTLCNGCCAGLDALALAQAWIAVGRAPRAIVAAVDLPLTATLLRAYAATGILSTNGERDPFSAATSGLLPGEGAAAACLEPAGGSASVVELVEVIAATESHNPLASGPAPGLKRLLRQALERHGFPAAVIPHASGTPSQARSEPAAIREVLGDAVAIAALKPWTGHTIGASGLLESALLAGHLRRGLAVPGFPSSPAPSSGTFFKLASAMGGRHSLAIFRTP